MKKYLFLIMLLCEAASFLAAQNTRYIIRFKDKALNPYSFNTPSAYLSAKAIERRIRYGIAIDSTDLPVTPRYIDSVRSAGTVTILNASKWLNAITIQTSDGAALSKINAFPFVISSAPIAAIAQQLSDNFPQAAEVNNITARLNNIETDFYNYGNSFDQIHIHNGEFLHNIGLRGQNMLMGVLDAGFLNYPTLRAFDSIRINNQITDTWDFVSGNATVSDDHDHGTLCFSTIASNIPDVLVGTAPKAKFLLYRTEEAATEYPIEEHNWVCGAERSDSAGADVISTSLGYSNKMTDPAFNHTYAQMNGNTTIAAIGADLAAKKGILVFASAGNDGANAWHYISTPADGDSVLAVGAAAVNGTKGALSSFGPSSDGQVKPDIMSVGVNTFVWNAANSLGTANGTSLACPNIAGLGTCLWQGFPEFNNMKIANALRQSGNKFSTPNDGEGYGIPDVKKAMLILLKDFATANATINNCQATINWTSKDVSSMKYEIERKVQGESAYTKIGERMATGNSFSSQTYQYTDALANIAAGPISYRIRQIIDTSVAGFRADYIDTVSATLSSACFLMSLAPNPSSREVSLIISPPNNIEQLIIKIIGMNGQVVVLQKETSISGTTNIPLKTSMLASGKYFVQVFDGNKLLGTIDLLRLSK